MSRSEEKNSDRNLSRNEGKAPMEIYLETKYFVVSKNFLKNAAAKSCIAEANETTSILPWQKNAAVKKSELPGLNCSLLSYSIHSFIYCIAFLAC